MITVSDQVKALLMENYRQIISIQFPNGNNTIELTESDIVQNTFKWDRYCAAGNMLEIGTAIAAEVEFSLRNDKGYFLTTGGVKVPVEDITFEGKELTIQIGICKWDAHRWEEASIQWFPIGKFIIMSMPHKFSTIRISALDRMTRFDVSVQENNPFASAEILSTMVQKMCNAVGMTYSYPIDLPNRNITVDIDKLLEEAPEVTYRMLIQWIAAMSGTCAYISVNGELVFRWLEEAEDVTLTPSNRYSSTVYEPVVFSGLVAEKNDQTMNFGSDSHYRFVISDNSLIQGDNWLDDYLFEINAVWNKLLATADPYRPFEAAIMPMPYLEPLDIISYEDGNGDTFETIITHITFALNGATSVSAVGVSETEASCVVPSGSTSRESADIKTMKNKIAALENATAAARERLTSLFRMALGLHVIEVTAPEGGTIYYFTTASVSDEDATLEELGEVITPTDVVYTFSGAGWMWCLGSDWDAASQAPSATVGWKYGITKDGSAVLGIVNAEGINVSDSDTVYNTVITPSAFSVFNNGEFVFGFNGQLESQINRLLVKSNIEDPTMENNAYIRLGSAMLIPASGGLDIVYVEDING